MRYRSPSCHLSFIPVLFFVLFGTSCRRTPPPPPVDPVTNKKQTPTTDRRELTNDSIFLYAKEVYFWNNDLPTYDEYEPRKYRNDLDLLVNYNENLLNIAKSSGHEDYDAENENTRYSYIDDLGEDGVIANMSPRKSVVDLDGVGEDIGLRLGYYGSATNFRILVEAVYPNSPADRADFVRGDEIRQINGVSYGTNFYGQIDQILDAVDRSTVTLTGVRGATNFNTTLNKTTYSSSPVYKTKVIDAGVKKIGYLSYSRFSSMENSMNPLDAAFETFASAGVTDLIVDLRYNGGGYVSTSVHLINLIAPAGTTGVMFSEHYNSTMQNKQATILKNQPNVNSSGRIIGTYFDDDYSVAANTIRFSKSGPLGNVKNVVFIVTDNSASASENVINSLKPHMNVKLVGEKTYGKPVGFFPITLENRYDVYYAMFELKNSRNEGGYYNGINVDVPAGPLATNGTLYDWGNPNDPSTAQALNLLAPGVNVTAKAAVAAVKQSATALKLQKLGSKKTNPEFIGMIADK